MEEGESMSPCLNVLPGEEESEEEDGEPLFGLRRDEELFVWLLGCFFEGVDDLEGEDDGEGAVGDNGFVDRDESSAIVDTVDVEDGERK